MGTRAPVDGCARGDAAQKGGLTEPGIPPIDVCRRRHEIRGVPQGTMTTHTHSASQLNITKLRHSAELCVLVVPFGLDAGMPETPALREVDL